ncbi:uncharacterized protein LOC115874660 isoform X2 [Sitophilus oryzae]|uniref:Uncharacterized protein LOC115874660 isoform X2 n=1 Tax=Sitophilus oryzae TaxID=7048 RepID=A0A6J2X474_SITOR|nr:uncharacterized protein LOC115874660 isoform X2 [Sitophilus oryzae]
MEHFLDCYLDNFKEAPRNSLYDRRTRKAMVEYINTLIEGCSAADDGDTEITCQTAVRTLVRYHQRAKASNGNVCMMGKYHNILYIAVRLCYLWGVKNLDIISELLRDIYSCEYTFERIIIGAIFGTRAPHYIAGWKSDFDDKEDNFRGLIYFLDKANKAKLEFPFELKKNETKLFRYLPIESCGKTSMVKLSVQLGLPDKLLFFTRFGALTSHEADDGDSLEFILNRLMEFNHSYPYNLVACLQILLRVTTKVTFKNTDKILKDVMMDQYESLIEDGIMPLSRSGFLPPELKHLCRCKIRECLWNNYNLPHRIHDLPLPDPLRKYIDILVD